MLKAVKPVVVKASKPKFMLSGPSGSGKTMFALNFPRPYLIDVEGGATREQYRHQMEAVGAGYFGKEQGAQDFAIVIAELQALATEKHEYRTVIIDSYSKLYNVAAADAEAKIGSDYGRDKKEANKPSRQLLRWIDRLDMTVILVCHTKDKWGGKGDNRTVIGTTFDGFEKFEYDLDLWLELQGPWTQGKGAYVVKKSRIDAFPINQAFPLDFVDFSKRYGRDVVEGESKPIVLASAEQVAEIKHLVDTIRVDETVIDKWFKMADVDKWDEMTAEEIGKCIAFLKGKIAGNGKTAKEKVA